jgi:hypothetical protein
MDQDDGLTLTMVLAIEVDVRAVIGSTVMNDSSDLPVGADGARPAAHPR